jgi:uncharacterized membrane protein YeaQ/YmgE (transglycosylase-associated protein family)
VPENLIASLVGGVLSFARNYTRGLWLASRLGVTGVFIAHYLTTGVSLYVSTTYSVAVESTAVAFLLALCGAEVLDKAFHLIRTQLEFPTWKK